MSQGFHPTDPEARLHSPLRKLGQWAIILAALSIVAIPLTLLEGPREIARWHEAAAVEHFLDGDYPASMRSLDEALRWDSESASIYLLSAHLKKRHGDFQSALLDGQEALKLRGDDLAVLTECSEISQHLGRHREAVEYWKKILKTPNGRRNVTHPIPLSVGGPISRTMALNGLAYARAVGGVELDRGLVDIQRAIELTINQIDLFYHAGCYHYHLGNFPAAHRDISAAWELAQTEYLRVEAQLNELREEPSETTDPHEKRKRRTALRQLKNKRKVALSLMAKLHVHRGMVAEKLHLSADAEEDFEQARRLGANVDELKKLFPDKEASDKKLGSAVAYLDTRGYIYFRRGELISARRDLETACDLALAQLDDRRRSLRQNQQMVVDPREHRLAVREKIDKHSAVIFYHRALLYRALGMTPQADADLRRVKELGFVPDEHLF